jgi:S1-C subfamily serine protease
VAGKGGQIVTNAHVVSERCTEIRVHLPGQDGIAAPALAIDRTSDLAVLSGVLPTLRPLPFRQSGPRAGDAVLTYGFPLAPILSTEGNVTTGNITALAGLANNSQMLQISAPVQPGNSGGPLVDLSGAVLGVVSQKLNAVAMAAASGDIAQNVNFAIKAGIVEGFLDANNVPYTTMPAGADQKPADVAERIKKSTVMVECWR